MRTNDTSDRGRTRDEPAEVEPLDEQPVAEAARRPIDTPEFAEWESSSFTRVFPSLFLDRDLRILRANESFCRLFACEPGVNGQYFTQFYASDFDAEQSGALFRAIVSPDTGFQWHGRLEKLGTDQRLNVSKVWILPMGKLDASPRAYGAFCLDMTEEHRGMLQGTFITLLEAARLKDNDTGNHIERVNRFSRTLAEDLAGAPGGPAVNREFIESIGLVAALHDVGKIGTPDDILNKAGRLEAWEWDVMKQHTTNGAYILAKYPNPMAREIALRHHERWDGTGYPHGLSGELIPLPARIVAVADVYDALRMRRSYKEAFTHEQAVASMASEGGTHFDPYLIKRFLAIAEVFRATFSDLADPA